MKKVSTLLVILTAFSCTSNLDRKVADKNGYEYFLKAANSLDSTRSYFEEGYKYVLLDSEGGQDGKRRIISDYSVRFEDLTFRKVLEAAEERFEREKLAEAQSLNDLKVMAGKKKLKVLAWENRRKLISDVLLHYEHISVLSDKYYEELMKKHNNIEHLIRGIIAHYEPEAEVSNEYLNKLYVKYGVEKGGVKNNIEDR